MARQRDPRRDEAFEIWKDLKGEITNRALAERLDVSEKTLSGWKSKDKWNDKLNGVLQSNKRSTPNKKVKKKARSPSRKEAIDSVSESDELTDKQRLFCIYYIKYFNATKAYQKAYDSDYKTANVNGSRLLVNASIRDEITRMKEERASGLLLSADDVLQKYIDIAFADIGDYVERGNGGFTVVVKPLEEMDSSIISELSNTENGIKLKLADKMKALDILSKYFDLLSDNDKKRLQEEKLKVEVQKTKAEVVKITGEEEEYEDDGFIEAIDSKTADVWSEADE
ncbi:terminase small subunit [Virgibacillus halodenitrificans]|uniref:terminase small subunit n=1 Tax=Virgibacillus halodenitrificans TaxID=1482 RepID=UPI000EF4F0FA|nr:terminase small subunit [Virgibacillus halodenitrificans]